MQRKLVEREMTSEGPSRRPVDKQTRRSVTVNAAESPLSWLHARGHIDDRLFDAGERLRSDYEKAQLSPRMTMSWSPVRVKGGDSDLTPTERQLAAKDRFDAALAQAGSGLADILWRVVCGGESLPVAEKSLAWPVRSGKLVLKLALDRVAAYYRIS